MSSDKQIDPDDIRKILQNKLGSGIQVEVFPQPQQQEEESDQVDVQEQRDQALKFDYKPSEIKKYLDRFVIQQNDAKKVLATAICDHYHHVQRSEDTEDWRDYKKQNILLIGPTGVGKTYLIQNIARLIGVPFVKADATKYSETGYVGGDVEDLIRELVAQAGNDVQLAERGIVYLDEIDKIASPANLHGRDVSGHGVQRNLLKLMEETEVPLRSSTDIAGQMQAFMEIQSTGKIEKKTINTRHILFIVSGAFNGLTEIIKKRIGSKQIGFMGEKTSADVEHTLCEQAKSVDFMEYGFEAEFAGRLPVLVHCQTLTVADLFDILKHSEGSILKQYKKDFLAYDIDVYFTDDGMQAIAEGAALEQTGARGLMSVCEKTFREFKYRLPDSDVREVVVTGKLVRDPQAKLEKLLAKPDLYSGQVIGWKLKKCESRLLDRYRIHVNFTPEAGELLSEKARQEEQQIEEYCQGLFEKYEHALNLLSKASTETPFVFDEDAVRNPDAAFEGWIRDTYR
jgi:endopeptidase Clp ATP-binding regulatory subunit ClpX